MNLIPELEALLGRQNVLGRAIDRVSYASDASLYRLVPQAVALPHSAEDVRSLFAFSHKSGVPLVFRAGGTSLAGQSITDGVLVEVARHWKGITVEDGGARVRLQPGVVGSHANNVLRSYGRRIGPDPASIDAALIGGIVANNASGMCCGVVENSYRTLHSLTCVLPNGLVLNTAHPQAAGQLHEHSPHLAQGLLDLRRRIFADPALVERIRGKYAFKNTTGYSLNALVDFDTPLDILAHLLVGSEGTLGFISEVVLNALPTYPFKYTGLLYFASVQDASLAVIPLRDSGARAIEIMDRASLTSVENQPGIPADVRQLPAGAAALLVEYQCLTAQAFADVKLAAERTSTALRLLLPATWTEDPHEQSHLWKIRKGIFPSIGAMRPAGSTVLIEDVVFPVAQMAAAIDDLHLIFRRYGFDDAVIYGHAKDGNLHFVITPQFDLPGVVQNYARFMDELADLVVNKYDGALKAEHGTGRNVAPFVQKEWGAAAYSVMRDLKDLFDPHNLLNPGVIINPDPQAHLKNLKPLPVVEEVINACMECGFCEPTCPSHELTLSPRRRIVARREIARLRTTNEDPALLRTLIKEYQFAGVDTCAADGLCGIACPVEINTGTLVKHLRVDSTTPFGRSVADWIAAHFGGVEDGLRLGLGAATGVAAVTGPKFLAGAARLGGKLLGTQLPQWTRWMPKANFHRVPAGERSTAQVVYFPSCISRAMGTSPLKGEGTLIETVSTLAGRAGVALWIPPDSRGNCCGMPFSSKGFDQAARAALHHTLENLWIWSDGGRLPVVIDTSSCALTLRTCADLLDAADQEKWRKITVLDTVEFVHDKLLPKLKVKQLPLKVAVHPNCSARKLHVDGKLVAILKQCAAQVTVPLNLGCDGFAGDRGFLIPDLTYSASRAEAEEILSQPYDGYFSSNLTCEVGMSMATDKPYRSFLYLVEEATR